MKRKIIIFLIICAALAIFAFQFRHSLPALTGPTGPSDAQIDKTIAAWSALDNTSPPADDNGQKSSANIIGLYSVATSSGAITLTKGEDTIENQDNWKLFMMLVPTSTRIDFVRGYRLIYDENRKEDASVQQNDDEDFWTFEINLQNFRTNTIQDKNFTLIHEIAHLLSLNINQVSADLTICPKSEIEDNYCPKSTSYIDPYFKKFWEDLPTTKQEFDENKYITEYAGTSYTEDFAESFATFVMKPMPTSTESMVNQKINFFYEFPYFVTIRKNMRFAIYNEIISATTTKELDTKEINTQTQ